jgi:hypothetical protein
LGAAAKRVSNVLKAFFREPLVHFLALALAIFVFYGAFNRSEAPRPDEIVVTDSKIEQLAGLFAKTWQRPPTIAELKGLVDDYVKEEIYYREALALGLDKEDTVIRRRLRLKMEFLSNAEAEALAPTDAELEAYLTVNPGKFEIDPKLAFRQVYLNPERRGDRIDQDVASILEALRSNPSADPATFGDATLLPSELGLTSKASIAQTFGADFAEAADKATPGSWTGPIKSSFGVHLVRVSECQLGRIPTLAEARDAVAREWSNDKRKGLEEQRLAELLKRYKITIEGRSESTPRAATLP